MIGAMLWGAIFVLLKTAALTSALEDKQIDFLNTRWEALNGSQRLRGEHREEDGHEETPVFEEASLKQPCVSEAEQAGRRLQITCVEGDSFGVTSAAFPFLEGCFGNRSDDGESAGDYERSSYIIDSEPTFSITFNNEILDSFWYVANVSNDSVEVYCVSEENSTALDHPVEATWICDEDGDGVFNYTNDSDFSTTCRCFSGARGGSHWFPLSAFTAFGVGLTAAAFLFVGM